MSDLSRYDGRHPEPPYKTGDDEVIEDLNSRIALLGRAVKAADRIKSAHERLRWETGCKRGSSALTTAYDAIRAEIGRIE